MSKLLKSLLIALAVGAAGSASAASWPSRAVDWVVPYSAGGGSDIIARTVGEALQAKLGQTIVVMNKPGAATIIGATYIERAKPAGYTLGTADSGTLAHNQSLVSNQQHDPAKLRHYGGRVRFTLLSAINQYYPLNTVKDGKA